MNTENEDRRGNQGDSRRFLPRDEAGRRDIDVDGYSLLPRVDDDQLTPRGTPGSYLFLLLAIIVIGTVSVRAINVILAPMLFDQGKITKVAKAITHNTGYATYDLNIETRQLRREHIRNLPETPDLVVMGASHWQEAHGAIMPGVSFYNAHVHRDYFEDIVAVASWLVKYDKLPKKLVISIRDNQFTAPKERTDFLWVPVLRDYREAAPMFGLTPHEVYRNGLTPQLRQTVSFPLLLAHTERYLEAPQQPHVSDAPSHATLDMLLSDGAIYWSEKHRAEFTDERMRAESAALAAGKVDNPPTFDPEGVQAVDTVLGYLRARGVELYLAHPPYNPLVWDAVQGTPYMDGLREIESLVQAMARRHGIPIIGSFNPYDIGCTADMYIDGEHSNPTCLGMVLRQGLGKRLAEYRPAGMHRGVANP